MVSGIAELKSQTTLLFSTLKMFTTVSKFLDTNRYCFERTQYSNICRILESVWAHQYCQFHIIPSRISNTAMGAHVKECLCAIFLHTTGVRLSDSEHAKFLCEQ